MKEVSDATTSSSAIDAEIAAQIRRLLDSQGRGYRSIRIEAHAGTVRLSGSVATYFLRQMAVTLAGKAAGVRQVVDELEVMLSAAKQARTEA